MNKTIILLITIILSIPKTQAQNAGEIAAATAAAAAITYVTIKSSKKEFAKEISHYRSKEYIANQIIGSAEGKVVSFETESLAADDSGGLISVAFNCTERNERGLLLAFFGDVRNEFGVESMGYAFKYIPLEDAQALFKRMDQIKEDHKKYLTADDDINNLYFEFDDIKFIAYKKGSVEMRVFWNGFEVAWEKTAINRTKRRLDKWFD